MNTFVRRLGEFFLDVIETLTVALSIFFVVYLFIFQFNRIQGDSMFPTFKDGENLLVDKVTYRINKPQRGDVVVFHAPPAAECDESTGCDYIKRIIGLPNERIEVKDGKVFINGEELNEPYISDDYETMARQYTINKIITLDSNEYFVFGDNRPGSSDSREWGPIQKQDIVGKVFFRYWPISAVGNVSNI